jgi:hypothetical protein
LLPVSPLNVKGDIEVAFKWREGSALRYRYLRLFGTPAIHISESFVTDYGNAFIWRHKQIKGFTIRSFLK